MMRGIVMNENLDLTKILDGCPKGTKFYSPLFGEVELDYIYGCRIGIACVKMNRLYVFNAAGKYEMVEMGCSDSRGNYYYSDECLLFPSKEQRDWSKFERFWDNPKTKKFENYNPNENNKKIEYRIWHIDAYAGWDDYDDPSDCNIHIDYIIDAKFTKQDVINMFCNKYNNSRVVVVCKCFLITDSSITYEQKRL